MYHLSGDQVEAISIMHESGIIEHELGMITIHEVGVCEHRGYSMLSRLPYKSKFSGQTISKL